MANIKFEQRLKVSLNSNNEIPFVEADHIDLLPKKDKVLIALALGLGISATVREWNNTQTKTNGLVIGDVTLEEVCNKFGILA